MKFRSLKYESIFIEVCPRIVPSPSKLQCHNLVIDLGETVGNYSQGDIAGWSQKMNTRLVNISENSELVLKF